MRPSTTEASRRRFLKYSGIAGTAVTLAGCRTRPDANRGQSNPAGQGSGGSNSGPLSGQTITIGSLNPAPDSWHVGEGVKLGSELAAKHLNSGGVVRKSGGGIAGATVEVKHGNTNLSPATAQQEYRRLVQREGANMTTGGFLTKVLLQIFPSMKQTQTPHLSSAAAGPVLAELVHRRYSEFKYHFRVGPINSRDLAKAEIEFLDRYADKRGWKRIAILLENISEFDPFRPILEKRAPDIVDVALIKRTSSGLSNWTPIWDELEAKNVDLALIGQALTGTPAVKQWANQKRQFEMGGIQVRSQGYGYWGSVNGDTRYLFTMNAMTPQTENTKWSLPFLKAYKQSFNKVPVYSAPLTYDAVMVYADAIERAVKSEGLSKIPKPDTVVKYLEQTAYKRSTVFNGTFKFRPKSDTYAHDPQWTSTVDAGVPIYQQWQYDPQVRKDYGTMHSVAPPQNQTNPYKYPHWIDYPSGHPARTGGGGKQGKPISEVS